MPRKGIFKKKVGKFNLSNVKKENVSQTTQAQAEKGFWDTAWDIVTEVIPAVIESIPIVSSFYKGVKSIFKWFF